MINKTGVIAVLVLQFFVSTSAAQHVFLVAGQSNAAGQGDSSLSVKVTRGAAFEYRYTQHALVPLKDPVGFQELNFQPAGFGSAWTAFAEGMFKISHEKIIIVPAARGGSSLTAAARLSNYDTWTESGSLFNNSVLKVISLRLMRSVAKLPLW